MIDFTPQAKEQRPANLKALHKQLKELVAKKLNQSSKLPQTHAVGVPVLVIRGK